MKFLKVAGSAILAAVLMTGCSALKMHPGAVNQFDSSTYDTLLVTHSVIESTKTDLAAGKFNSAETPVVKQAVNDLVAAYNALDSAYQIYHLAAAGSGATSQQISNVNTALANVNAATTNLSNAKAAN